MLASYLLLFAIGTSKVYEIIDNMPVNPNIKNVVVMVLENRSFDSFMGRLRLDGLNPDVDGPTSLETNNLLPTGQYAKLRRNPSLYSKIDPGHSLPHTSQEIYAWSGIPDEYQHLPENCRYGPSKGHKPGMRGFGASAHKIAKEQNVSTAEAEQEVFGLHGPETIPTLYKLALEYGIIDNYFAAFPGPTQPNLHFIHAATANGYLTSDINLFLFGMDVKTTFANLDTKNLEAKVYCDGGIIKNLYGMYHYFRRLPGLLRKSDKKGFIKDAAAGKLPAYSFVQGDSSKTDFHPRDSNIGSSDDFVREIYEALKSSPQWNSTLFLITFDEHGGFYDHVSPPENIPAPDDVPPRQDTCDFKFNRLGIRVPAIVISPWIPKGSVFRSNVPGRYMEHSSISSTLKHIFNLDRFLTKRDEWAVPFHGVVNFLKSPRTQ